ncbi:hypothetical protein BT96DRAFT_1027100 [Gymnopus androsaceus JB14]|uniref:Uncharacterized protein n=1 Tax=Gymnopus androsaceus JB14 TaxID=1447944 RepID=A0A6A4GDR5_9AGAR|nr:hypothetical protein BT96DRAFT_1027100 [Gymnopus androsaceus JB14]
MSSNKAGISGVNFVADLVRYQGEELLRVRKELELTQTINAASIETLRATEKHVEDLQQNCSQLHLRFSSIGQELLALQTENDSMARQLEATRADLRIALSFANLSESSVIEDRVPSSSTSIAVAGESDSDGYTRISFSNITGSRTSSAIGATDSPIPGPNVIQVGTTEVHVTSFECGTSGDSLNVHACGSDYAVSERNRDELEKVKESHSISAWSDEEAMPPESLRVLDAGNNETQPIPKSGSSKAATVDLDQKNGEFAVTPSTKQHIPASLDGIPRDVDHPVKCLNIESLKPVCSKLPKPGMRKAVNAVCLKAIGLVAKTRYYVLKIPAALLEYPNINNRTLITVSRSANNLTKNLKKLESGWKGHILLRVNPARELYYLGEYESGGSCRIAYSEYDSLPEKTKLYILNCAKALRKDIHWTNAQMALDMSKDTGIYIVKIELRFIGYNSIIESRLGKEARQNGYIDSEVTST